MGRKKLTNQRSRQVMQIIAFEKVPMGYKSILARKDPNRAVYQLLIPPCFSENTNTIDYKICTNHGYFVVNAPEIGRFEIHVNGEYFTLENGICYSKDEYYNKNAQEFHNHLEKLIEET